MNFTCLDCCRCKIRIDRGDKKICATKGCEYFKFSEALVNREPIPKDGKRILATLEYRDKDRTYKEDGLAQEVIFYNESEDIWYSDFGGEDIDDGEIINWEYAPDLKKIVAANKKVNEK